MTQTSRRRIRKNSFCSVFFYSSSRDNFFSEKEKSGWFCRSFSCRVYISFWWQWWCCCWWSLKRGINGVHFAILQTPFHHATTTTTYNNLYHEAKKDENAQLNLIFFFLTLLWHSSPLFGQLAVYILVVNCITYVHAVILDSIYAFTYIGFI